MSDSPKPSSSTDDFFRLLLSLGKAQGTAAEIISTLRSLEKTAGSKLEPIKPELKEFTDDALRSLKNLDTKAFPGLALRGQDLLRRVRESDGKATATTTPEAPAAEPVDATARLQQLKELLESDLITEQEYQVKRQDVIDSL